MQNSHIEWTDHTFNPWIGCTKVSPGCTNCYAEALNKRWKKGANWGPGAPRQRTSPAYWKQPIKWNHDAIYKEMDHCDETNLGKDLGVYHPPRVFCASLADWLDKEVPIEWLADLLDLIGKTPNLDWLLLTKRPGNWRERIMEARNSLVRRASGENREWRWIEKWGIDGQPPENVWIGTTVEDQKRADERIPLLLTIPAKVRFLSCEPLLGHVDLLIPAFNGSDSFSAMAGIDWVIAGGESGGGARAMSPEWALDIRNQCLTSRTAFFFKQWGEHDASGNRVGKKASGRALDREEWSQFPEVRP